jgi:hypothetical protein
LAAIVCVGAPIAVLCLYMLRLDGPPRPITSDQVAPLGHAVDIAIAFCIGYLTLDRFRIHKKVVDMASGMDVPKPQLFANFKAGNTNNDATAFVTLFYLAGDDEAASAVVGKKQDLAETDFFKSWRGSSLRWFLRAKGDRKIVIVVLTLLCVWQFVGAIIELRSNVVADHLHARLAWSVLMTAILGFAYPAINILWSERMLQSIKVSSRGWLESYAKVIQEQVGALEVPTPAAGVARAPSGAARKARSKPPGAAAAAARKRPRR